MKPWILLPVLAGVWACERAPTTLSPLPTTDALRGSPTTRVIVTLRDRNGPAQVARDHGLSPRRVFAHVLNGFAGEFSSEAVSALARDPRVARIEPDAVVSAAVVPPVTWGLDRIDQRKPHLDGVYSFNYTGSGVSAYVVDSGIRYSHDEFVGRAVFGADVFGGDGSDCAGHGTHVAGTIGGVTYGVAKKVRLVSVRVLDCTGSGTVSGVIAGLDWIAANRTGPSVANLSLQSDASASLDEAVQRLVDSGVTVVVAAGNGGSDACNVSPARVPAVLTMGATDRSDTRTSFSNYGACVDWFAPGMGITSAGSAADSASAVLSGTSMAAPHTAGAVALYLEQTPSASPAQVEAVLRSRLSTGVVANANSPHPDLLYTLESSHGGDSGSTADVPPTAGFVASCAGLACTFTDQSVDSDGSIVAWAWDFGDGSTSSSPSPSHAYGSGSGYTVRLVVTDNGGLASAVTHTVSASDAAIVLTVQAKKVRGKRQAVLSWSGATGATVDVFRNGQLLISPANSGGYTDGIGSPGTYVYKVCNSGSGACSDPRTITL